MIAWWLAAALAQEEAVIDALQGELGRSVAELSLPGSPSIYHLRYKVWVVDRMDLVATRGATLLEDRRPFRGLGVEVRVGDPSYDNTGFGGWEDGMAYSGLPADLDPLVARRVAWRVTDRAFKDAVEQYSRKQAQAVLPPDHPGDYQLTGPVVADDGAAGVGDRDALRRLVLDLSAIPTPGLELSEVHAWHVGGSWWVLDSEGTRVRTPLEETFVRAIGRVVLPDGAQVTDERLWVARGVEDLPSRDALEAGVRAMVDELTSVAAAPALDDEYVGPVVLADAAAADLFRYLLLPQLEGTPPEQPFDTWLGDIGGGASGSVRLGRRALPPGWTVVDDPMLDAGHPGAARHDGEGTPTRPVRLVEDGIVRDLAMSRTPRRGLGGTNGHAQADLYRRSIGKTSLTVVEPRRALSEARLLREGLKLAAAYGRDWVMVVRRLEEPSATHWDAPDADDPPPLPSPVLAFRHYADGREEPVRGLTFGGVQRWALRDIAAAGPSVTRDWLGDYDDDVASLDPVGGVAMRLVAPSVLVGEMELVPVPGDPSEVPVLSLPEGR
ncbi:MAG TPA: metallopeptidase TldD-related protein [Myxococcota bacterium]|nr:metallopeptidase TldD-related protein [Myxococcota bacterium]